jgi:hypothetical protein
METTANQGGTAMITKGQIVNNTKTQEDIKAGYQNEEWRGWGYLGERSRCTDAERVELADAALLDAANYLEADDELFFAFLNSTFGRHYGDRAFATKTATCNELRHQAVLDIAWIDRAIKADSWY